MPPMGNIWPFTGTLQQREEQLMGLLQGLQGAGLCLLPCGEVPFSQLARVPVTVTTERSPLTEGGCGVPGSAAPPATKSVPLPSLTGSAVRLAQLSSFRSPV